METTVETITWEEKYYNVAAEFEARLSRLDALTKYYEEQLRLAKLR